MSALKSECRKFSPNVFNKTKCQNCFRTKEAHSAEALENNRASRNVSKCGYLFVAPDWDFNVSVNRTKRWQRRWFKLFDDGELTYALDEFPDTIPQGTIDMNKVLDVSDAESLTGNEFAIALTTPEKVHFIKGTSKEESKWWFDALSRVLPRHLSRGKHKRNATFPCGKAIIPPSNVISQDYSEDDIRLKDYSRPKFLSTSELNDSDEKEWNLTLSQEDEVFCAKDEGAVVDEDEEKTFTDKNVEVKNALNNIIPESVQKDIEGKLGIAIIFASFTPLYLFLTRNKEFLFDENNLSTHRRNRRYLKRENRVQRNQRSRFDGVSKMIPSKKATDKHLNDAQDSLGNVNALSAIAASEKLEYLESIQSKENNVTSPSKEVAEDDSSSTDTIGSVRKMNSVTSKKTNLRKSESLKNIPSQSHSEMRDQVTNLRRYHSFRGSYSSRKQKPCIASNQKKVKLASNSFRTSKDSSAARVEHMEAAAADTSNDVNSQDVFMKTGWILRQTLTKEWSRHWFVLKDSSLTYYRDPSAEHCGIMDGILDLNQVSSIREYESDRHYAFCLLMWDGKKHILAAETEEMRFTWIQAIQYATNLWSSESKEDFIKTEIVLPEHNYSLSDRISSPSSLISLQSLEEDGPSESSSSDDQSEYFSIVDEDEDTPCSNYHDDDLDMILSLHNIINENNLCYLSGNSCHTKEAYNADSKPDSNQERLSKSEEDMTETEFSEADTYYGKIKSEDVFRSYSADAKSEDGCYACSKFKSKLIAAKEEIRKLREELREAHSSFDNLEMFSFKIQQDMKAKEQSYESQIALMTAKIDDLTGKFTIAERNYRQLKQKVAKDEYKQEKRKSSLKNKDVLSLSKEYESKLSELEVKMMEIESSIRKGSSDAESEISSSQETNEITELPQSPSKHQLSNGLFSRLQSLGARVKTADETVSEQSLNIENNSKGPKICVQVRESEGSSSLDDSDDWQTVTLTKNAPNGFSVSSDKIPKTFSDLKSMFTQKLHSLFDWFKLSLNTISQKFESEENEEKSKLITCVNEVLDVLYGSVPEDIKSSETRLIYYFVLLFSEASNVYERINSVSFIDSLLKLNVTEWTFSVISKLLCNIFISDKKSNVSGIIRLTTEIPQLKRFCPLFNKLLHPTNQDSSFSTSVEKVTELTNQYDEILELFDKAKNKRFIALWDTLSDVPVQDDAANSQKIKPMLRYVTSIASSVFQAAEMQLCSFQSQSLHILKAEHDVIHSWCSETYKALTYIFQTFLVDLKEQCPMINELTVPISELSNASHTEITSVVSELAFLYIAGVVLETAMSFILESKDCATLDSVPHEKWIIQLKRNYSTKTNFVTDGNLFDCSQCIVLNATLSQTKIEAIGISNENYCESKSISSGLKFETENSSALSSTCASCLEIFTENMLNKKAEMELSNRKCSQCERLQVQLNVLEKEHQSELNSLANNFRNELEILEERLQSNNEVHEQVLRKKEDELESTVSELQRLKNEYEDKIQNFKNLYEQKLRLQYDNIEDNTICEIYKREIEDVKVSFLQDMFKKGLVAIENSHNRITSEMEKRHKDEVALLNAEKQKALELEAEATIKALEAIKKSHAKQLKEEKTSIKEELMNKLQIDGQYETFYQKYGNELQELKAEILHITDLYSEKCLENVALEEKVNSLRQQLQEAHNELYELLIRNRDLDLHLSAN
ncbi:protein outspread-like [Uloborus diversus]|uniref:protein outspread-like n=1 Tax=Uloborus diversus TaxID=327109 RepID=UPI0024093A83|nr:protein outspread-like [Uloborus diversus]